MQLGKEKKTGNKTNGIDKSIAKGQVKRGEGGGK